MLEIKNLTVKIRDKRVIDNVTFEVRPGRITALVGESGSGKTMTALAILDLLPRSAVREKGEVTLNGRNIFTLAPEDKRRIRGKDIAIVFQEPFSALDPVLRVGRQVEEAITAHEDLSGEKLKGRVAELLQMVKLPPATAESYPHELSGGMQQRVLLAAAISCDPGVLILDEPTTALDVSIQKQILDLIKQIQEKNRFDVLFITHDFSIVNMIADEVCVMKQGVMVEKGPKEDVLRNPRHPYTKYLIECIPRIGDKRRRLPQNE